MRPTDECHPNENVYPYLARSRRLDRLAAGGLQSRLWAPSTAAHVSETGDTGWFTSSGSRFGGSPSCDARALSSRAARGDRASDTPVERRLSSLKALRP